MKKWLTSLFLFFALASGVAAGTPVFANNAENGMSAMECCKKKKAQDCSGADTMSAAQLCCAINCNGSAPTAPGNASINFSPSSIIISDSILKQIAALFIKERAVSTISFSFERQALPPNFQPKYIQHHSFLI